MVELRFPLCANFVILALEQLRKIVFHTGLIELQTFPRQIFHSCSILYHRILLPKVMLILLSILSFVRNTYYNISTPFNFVTKLEKLDASFLSSRIPRLAALASSAISVKTSFISPAFPRGVFSARLSSFSTSLSLFHAFRCNPS